MVESIFLACSLITSCIQIGGWAVAYALRTEKFYDILGGLNFLAVAAFSAATAAGWEADARKVAATVIFCCSRSWLLVFLAWRAHAHVAHSALRMRITPATTYAQIAATSM